MLCKCLTLLGERLQPKLLLKNWIFKRKAIWSLADADDLFKDLQEQLDKLAAYNPKCLPEGTNANDIVSVDDSHKHWATNDWWRDLMRSLGWRRFRDRRWHMMFLMNQFAHNLVMCVNLWMYFENTCYLVIMESLFTNV